MSLFMYVNISYIVMYNVHNRSACPNFGHPAKTSSSTKYKLDVKNDIATIVNKMYVIFKTVSAFLIYKVRKPRMNKLWHGVRRQGTLP